MVSRSFAHIARIGCIVGLSQSCAKDPEITIENLHTGKIRSISNELRLYEPGEQFQFVANNTCDVNGDRVGCIKFGFSFDYRTSRKNVVLTCRTEMSEAVAIQSHDGSVNSVYNTSFLITLPDTSGNIVHPHSFYKQGNYSFDELVFTTLCFHRSKQLFSTQVLLTDNR